MRLGQFHEAIQSYETIVEEAKPESTGFPDFRTPFNLIVCYYASRPTRSPASAIGVPQPTSYDDDDDDRMPDAGASKRASSRKRHGRHGVRSQRRRKPCRAPRPREDRCRGGSPGA